MDRDQGVEKPELLGLGTGGHHQALRARSGWGPPASYFTAPTLPAIHTLSLHDALPILPRQGHNTPLPLKRSAPGSFKRLLGVAADLTMALLTEDRVRAARAHPT